MENGKFFKLFGLIFSIVGLIAIVAGIIFLVFSIRDVPGEQEITATISDITSMRINKKTSHHAYVDYVYNDVHYSTVKLNYYSSSMRIGDEIVLYIDPLKPDRPYRRDGLLLGSLIPALLGIVFMGIGIPFWVVGARNIKEIESLLTDGRAITCVITDIKTGTSSMNGVRAKIVTCRNIDMVYADEEYTSKSVYIPDGRMPKIGDAVCVFVDRNDSRKYYVEVTESTI